MCSSFLTGFGPLGLAKEENPFPLVTKIFVPIAFTHVGYHPVGMNPLDLLLPGLLTSNRARQLLSALAIYKVFSSGLNASPLVVEPSGALGYREEVNVSITFFEATLITETELSLELATNKYLPLFARQISLGLSPMFI